MELKGQTNYHMYCVDHQCLINAMSKFCVSATNQEHCTKLYFYWMIAKEIRF